MTIENLPWGFDLTCDDCGDTEFIDEESFSDVLAFIKRDGWKSKLVNGEWEHYCPACREPHP